MIFGTDAIIALGVAATALTQLIKWAGLPDKIGPIVVLGLSLLLVIMWQFSFAPADRPIFMRQDTWPLFSAWLATSLTSAGVFGFTRAAAGAVTAMKPPPAGAAQNPTDQK